jgi:predicted dehydrogenase
MRRERSMSRRSFLRKGAGAISAAAAFPYFVPATAFGKAGTPPPSERIVVGVIGAGGQGQGDMMGFLASADARVVAVCDPKGHQREAAKLKVNQRYGNEDCRTYNDFRDLVARTDIDAVLIGSNDHWHVLHALAAVRSGKDIYVEKPLGLSIQELKTLRDAVHRYGRVFQFGTQQRSMPNFRHACELVRNGRIGQLKNIRVSAPCRFAELTNDVTYTPAPVPADFDY